MSTVEKNKIPVNVRDADRGAHGDRAQSDPPIAENAIPAADQNLAEYLWNVHNYINEYIRFADTKAGAVIVFASGMFAALYAANAQEYFIHVNPTAWGFIGWLGFTTFMLLALGVGFAGWSICPRLYHKQQHGFIFWESVLGHDGQDSFWLKLNTQSGNELTNHLSRHVYVLSRVAKVKYRLVGLAIWANLIGTLMAAFFLLWFGKQQ